jgi:hypothetical protein
MDIGGIIVLEYFSLPMFEKKAVRCKRLYLNLLSQFTQEYVAATIVSVPRFDRERKGCKEKALVALGLK